MRSALAILILFAGTAASAGAAGWDAVLQVEGDLALSGEPRLTTSRGAVDLSDARTVPGLQATWARGSGELVTNEWVEPVDGAEVARPARSEPVTLASGGLVRIACDDRCRVYLFTVGDASRIAVSGRMDAALQRLPEDVIEWSEFSDRPRTDAFWHRMPAGAIAVGQSHTPIEEGRIHAEGRLGLFVKNAVVEVETEDGMRRIDARSSHGGVAATPAQHHVTRFVVLTLEDAEVATEPDAPARWMAEAADVALDGTLRLQRATGDIRHAGGTATAQAVDVVVEGPVEAHVASPAAGGDGLRVAFRVDGTEVALAGRPLPDPSSLAAPLTVAAVLVSLLALLRFLPWALYTRLDRTSVLRNENRRRILDAVAVRPGVHASELAYRLRMTRVVVQHHLHHLETHGFVRSRVDGRARSYFTPETRDAHAAVRAHAALRNVTRRRIFDALAAGGRAVQREIAERTGIPLRTVSYHLPALEAAGLVVGEGQSPRSYSAAAAPTSAEVRSETG